MQLHSSCHARAACCHVARAQAYSDSQARRVQARSDTLALSSERISSSTSAKSMLSAPGAQLASVCRTPEACAMGAMLRRGVHPAQSASQGGDSRMACTSGHSVHMLMHPPRKRDTLPWCLQATSRYRVTHHRAFLLHRCCALRHWLASVCTLPAQACAGPLFWCTLQDLRTSTHARGCMCAHIVYSNMQRLVNVGARLYVLTIWVLYHDAMPAPQCRRGWRWQDLRDPSGRHPARVCTLFMRARSCIVACAVIA